MNSEMLCCAPPALRSPGLGTSTCFSAAVKAWHARVRTHQPGGSTSPLHTGAHTASSPCTRGARSHQPIARGNAHYVPPFAHGGARCPLPSHSPLHAALASPRPLLHSHTNSHPAHSPSPGRTHNRRARCPLPPHTRLPSHTRAHPASPPQPTHRPARQQEGAALPARCPARSRPVRPRPARRLGGRLGGTPLMAHSPSISASRSSPFPQLSAHGSATSRSPRMRSSSARRAGSCAEIQAQPRGQRPAMVKLFS